MRARRGDTTAIEIKRAHNTAPHDLAKTICAFANMPNGGTIILGVREAKGAFEIEGVGDLAQVEAGVASQARDVVEPAAHVGFTSLEYENADILIVTVAPLDPMARPARVNGHAYLRQSDGDYVMGDHELRAIEAQKILAVEVESFDEATILGLSVDDLDSDLVEAYIREVRKQTKRLRDDDDDTILIRTTVTKGGVPTIAGLYAFGDYPQGRLPALTVTAAVQLPYQADGPRTRAKQDFCGPLPEMLEDIMEWVSNNLDTLDVYGADGHLSRIPELPLPAIRELVSNALIHRDLGHSLRDGKSIQIRLTPDQFFVQSPGGLKGVAMGQLMSQEHAQAAVNPHLYPIARKCKTSAGKSIVEGEGGGIRTVIRLMAEHGLRPPQFVDTGIQFTARLWRPERDTIPQRVDGTDVRTRELQNTTTPAQPIPTVPRERPGGRNGSVLLRVFERGQGDVSFTDLVNETELTASQVRYALNKLLASGLVLRDGGQGDRTTTYRRAHGGADLPARAENSTGEELTRADGDPAE